MDPQPSIDDLASRDGFVTTASLAEALGVSRQAAHRHLLAAMRAGRLTRMGAARATRYLPTTPTWRFDLSHVTEEQVWSQIAASDAAVSGLDTAERAITVYVVTAMVNNAIDHSLGTALSVQLAIDAERIAVVVEDDGIGAFASVRRALGLATDLEAAAAITKAKVTSMPERHSGEGFFFSSRVADSFVLESNRLGLIVDTLRDDLAIAAAQRERGTRVEFKIARPPRRTLRAVFEAHTEQFEFAKTRTVVKLFGLGRDFVSRSEARRILEGLDRFREVIVDFEGVPGIGQGFADEVFRVFPSRHPGVRLVPIRMNDEVNFFVERALRASKSRG